MLRLVFALAIGIWLGAVVHLSFVVTPTAHGLLTPQEARRLLRPLFPRYYALGILCGFVALAAVALGKAGLSQEELLRLSLPTATAIALNVVARQRILPRMQEAGRDDPEFDRLHRVSAMLNSTTLAALVLAMAAAVTR